MKPPARIQLSRRQGWRMPPNMVKVDRTARWGNPLQGGSGLVVSMFREHRGRELYWCPVPANKWPKGKIPAMFMTVDELRAGLHGKNLACWCPLDQPCHADVLLEIANG